MLEELKKYRELAAFVLLGAAALRLLAQLIGAFLYDDGRGLNFLYGARIIGISVLDPLLAIALVAFVAWCARDKTRNARLLALCALIVVGVGTITAEPAGEYSSTATPSAAMTSETACTRSGSTSQPCSLACHAAAASPSSAAVEGER